LGFQNSLDDIQIDCNAIPIDISDGITAIVIVIYTAIGIGSLCSICCLVLIIRCLCPGCCPCCRRSNSPNSPAVVTRSNKGRPTVNNGQMMQPLSSSTTTSSSGYAQHFDVDSIETELGVMSPSSDL
jgi:hypothetical protein